MTKKQKKVVALLTEAPYMTVEDVAKTLRVRTWFVYAAARRFGLKYRSIKPPVPTPRERGRIVHLAQAGMNDKEIASRLDLRTGTVTRIRLAANLRQRGQPIFPTVGKDTHIKIARMRLVEGRSYGRICIALGVTRGCVAGAIYRARHENWDLSESVEKEVERV